MKEQIPQPAPLSRTLQGKTREANTASVINVLQAYKKDISQRQEVDEDELLQGKFETAQRVELEDDELLQGKFETTQRQETPNNTCLPDNLKAGVEQLSGLDMSDVKVHYNSSKPASVQAYAYTQGTDIHVAPGQEKHLGHEAWHVAQQKQGRVQPTTTVGGLAVNDNAGLESEADVMGGKAVQMKPKDNKSRAVANSVAQNRSILNHGFGFVDNRPKAVAQRKLQEITNKNPKVNQLKPFREIINNNPNKSTSTVKSILQYREVEPGVLQREGSGLASDEAIEAYTGAGKTIFDAWQTLNSINRAVCIGKLVNNQLKSIGVHPCSTNGSMDLGSINGKFNFPIWCIDINKNLLEVPNISKDQFASLINTMYHEARHCEQWFRSARWLAGMGRSNAAIAHEMQIPLDVADSACQNQLLPVSDFDELVALSIRPIPYIALEKRRMELAEAKEWYNSVYGKGDVHRRKTFRNFDLLKEHKKKIDEKILAEDEFIFNKNADLEKMQQVYEALKTVPELLMTASAKHETDVKIVLHNIELLKNEIFVLEILIQYTKLERENLDSKYFAAYKALPEETDAWAVGDNAEAKYKEKFQL